MDIIPMQMCSSNLGWQHETKSSDGHKSYTVSFDRLPPSADYEYGFSCACQAFKFGGGKECKHIIAAKQKFCGWHQQHDGGDSINGKCPRCGSESVTVMCAV